MNQNYSHSLAPKYSILLDPSGRMNIQQTILTVTTTINSNKVQIKTLIQTERKFHPRTTVKLTFYAFINLFTNICWNCKLVSQPFSQYAKVGLIYYSGCEFGLCPFYPFPLSPIVLGRVWSGSLTIPGIIIEPQQTRRPGTR